MSLPDSLKFPNDMRPIQVALYYNDLANGGSSDKVYHLSLTGAGHQWTTIGQYGRRGSALQSQAKAKDAPYVVAKKAFDKVLAEKWAKGYLPIGTPVDAPVAPTTSIEVDIKPPELLEEVTNGDHLKFIDDPAYWMQDKSDGHSRGVVKQKGEIFGINKRGVPVPLPAELLIELRQIKLTEFQLDAELVGDKLIVRDLLVADEDISAQPYRERFTQLYAHIPGGFKYISIVQTWTGPDKAPALEASREARREGVVFKLISAPYRAGRNGQHKKYKFIKTLSAVAGKPGATGKESVELFLWDADLTTDEGKGKWIKAGTVSLIGKPAVNKGDVVEVAYLYAMPSKNMIQARILSIRTDVTVEECTTNQLIMKREEP